MLMLTMTACAYWNGTYMYVIDETGILKKAFEDMQIVNWGVGIVLITKKDEYIT